MKPTAHLWLVGIVFLILLYFWVGPYLLWLTAEWLFKAWLLWLLVRQLFWRKPMKYDGFDPDPRDEARNSPSNSCPRCGVVSPRNLFGLTRECTPAEHHPWHDELLGSQLPEESCQQVN